MRRFLKQLKIIMKGRWVKMSKEKRVVDVNEVVPDVEDSELSAFVEILSTILGIVTAVLFISIIFYASFDNVVPDIFRVTNMERTIVTDIKTNEKDSLRSELHKAYKTKDSFKQYEKKLLGDIIKGKITIEKMSKIGDNKCLIEYEYVGSVKLNLTVPIEQVKNLNVDDKIKIKAKIEYLYFTKKTNDNGCKWTQCTINAKGEVL